MHMHNTVGPAESFYGTWCQVSSLLHHADKYDFARSKTDPRATGRLQPVDVVVERLDQEFQVIGSLSPIFYANVQTRSHIIRS